MKKALITGITGFAGSFLAEHLLDLGYDVHGVVRSTSNNKNLTSIESALSLHSVNLEDEDALTKLIERINPNSIFHLAAFTSPSESFKKPQEVFTNNISLQLSILEALKKSEVPARLLVTSSAEIYGMVDPRNLPLSEDAPLNPTSPYAVSKIAQDYLALQYFLSHNLDIVRIRPFNHIGPRQGKSFVVAAFASQIAEIEKGKQPPVIRVGNLEAKRDFTDVKDMVKAYSLINERGESGGVYNVGSGISHKISEILNMLLSFSSVRISIETDPERLRPSDTPDIVSDNTKVHNLGWSTKIPLEDTLRETLEYWRNIV